MRLSHLRLGFAISALGLSSTAAPAATVMFSGATATFHQTFDRDWNPSEMIDGITMGSNGWAIFRDNGAADQTQSEIALFTLASPLAAGATSLSFTMIQNYVQSHTLGDFSFGYTTDASPTLGGTYTPFTVTGESATNPVTFNALADEVIVSGANPDNNIYTIGVSANAVAPITGIYLKANNNCENGLPTCGPGRAYNGNFVLTEFEASTVAAGVPEPAAWAMMTIGLFALGGALRARRTAVVGA